MNWKVAADPYARKIGLYSSYQLSTDEFIGRLERGWKETLEANGYEPSPTFMGISLEAAKTHPDSGEVHDYSLRKVDPESRRWHWHAHFWITGHLTIAAVHYEMRPDITILEGETLIDAKQRLSTHYRPEGNEYLKGVADETLKELVE